MLSISIPWAPRRAVEKGRNRSAPSPQSTSSPRILGSSASRSTLATSPRRIPRVSTGARSKVDAVCPRTRTIYPPRVLAESCRADERNEAAGHRARAAWPRPGRARRSRATGRAGFRPGRRRGHREPAARRATPGRPVPLRRRRSRRRGHARARRASRRRRGRRRARTRRARASSAPPRRARGRARSSRPRRRAPRAAPPGSRSPCRHRARARRRAPTLRASSRP